MYTFFLQIVAAFICILTASGMIVHDLRIDKAAVTALATPVAYANYETANKLVNFSDLHTHVERSAFSQTDREPATPTRFGETRKYLLQKYSPRGHHAFDSYNLPIL